MNFAKTLRISDITSVLRSAPAAAFGGTLFWNGFGFISAVSKRQRGRNTGSWTVSCSFHHTYAGNPGLQLCVCYLVTGPINTEPEVRQAEAFGIFRVTAIALRISGKHR